MVIRHLFYSVLMHLDRLWHPLRVESEPVVVSLAFAPCLSFPSLITFTCGWSLFSTRFTLGSLPGF